MPTTTTLIQTWVVALCLIACGGKEPLVLLDADGNVVASNISGGARPADDPCATPDGFDEVPSTITELVSFLNAMQEPVDLPCFLQALPRPLKAHASESVFSAQPASGVRSPRIFVFGGGLIMTVVPEGIGSHLLELGEIRSETRTLKGELKFPVEDDLDDAAPYEDMFFDDDITSCAFCHAQEEPDPAIDFTRAFISDALRPLASQRVPLADLVTEERSCDPEMEPERCALLEALFSEGEVEEAEFPETFSTFF